MNWVPKTSGAKAVTVLLVLVSAIALGAWLVDSVLWTYPTPETQTQFLNNYSPDKAIKPFIVPGYLEPGVSSTTSSAGHGIASHDKYVESTFAVHADDRANLLTAVLEDLVSQLENSDVRIVLESGDTSNGFELRYARGKTKGTVKIEALQIAETEQVVGHAVYHSGRLCVPRPLGPQELPVCLRVRIQEKWYRAGTGQHQSTWSLSDQS